MPDNFRLRLEVDDVNLPARQMFDIAERARNAKPVLAVIKKLMERAAHEQWATEGSRSGKKWLQDKPETVARKVEEGLSPKTEHRHGDLGRSIMGGEGAIRRLSKSSTTYGTRIFYSRYQGRKRELLTLTAHDADRYAELMVNFLLEGQRY